MKTELLIAAIALSVQLSEQAPVDQQVGSQPAYGNGNSTGVLTRVYSFKYPTGLLFTWNDLIQAIVEQKS